MGVLSFTPLAWEIGGRGETYPELLYAGLGLPFALIATVAGALLAWTATEARPADWSVRALRIIVAAAVSVCAGLTLLLSPLCPLPPAGLLDSLFILALPAMALAVVVSGFATIRRRVKSTDVGQG